MKKIIVSFFIILVSYQKTYSQSSKMTETPLTMYDGKRKALLIGNKNYQFYRTLSNTERDVDAMSKVLKNLGFEVSSFKNLDYQATVIALRKFKETLKPNDVALIYYSGHGIGSNTQSYILPVDASIKCTDELEVFVPLSLNKIIKDLEQRQVRNNFVFLDACRNLPNLSACSNDKDTQDPRGLVMPKTNPRGNLIVFATGEGKTADDDTYDKTNSLFTAELIKNLQTPNVGIRSIIDLVSNAVEKRSNGKQIPQKLEDLRGDFVFLEKEIEKTDTEKELQRLKEENERLKNGIVAPPTIRKFMDLPFAEMVFIKGGSFEMGSREGEADEKNHTVRVGDFWMGKYEISVKQYLSFCEATQSHYPEWMEKGSVYNINTGTDNHYKHLGKVLTADDHPIVGISHQDAEAFCAWLSQREGIEYRLPTEAEWEYAAGNGGVHTEYSWGNTAPNGKSGNLSGTADGYEYTSPVGRSYAANELGLHNMTGNVWEWCSDWYGADYYKNSHLLNPKGPEKGDFRVLRGGGWSSGSQFSRVAYRGSNDPGDRDNHFGFRVVSSQ